MKRWIVGVILILTLLIASVYLLIPSPLRISNSVPVKTSASAGYRSLLLQKNWDSVSGGDIQITQRLANSIKVAVKQKEETLDLDILLIPAAKDSMIIMWQSSMPVVKNPVSKIQQYFSAVNVKNEMDHAFNRLKTFLENRDNIYGMSIRTASTTDTFLITTRFNTTLYPTTTEIYTEIKKLQDYAKKMNAKQSGDPMLNATTTDSISFECMVAIPIDKRIEDSKPFSLVRMIPAKFLTMQITGGPNTIHAGHQIMDDYIEDFKESVMAKPFEYLVTNRMEEADTSKWVTRLYVPVK